MNNNKIKKKPLIFILLLLLTVAVGSTFAYYYNEVIIPNKFKAMTYSVAIEEVFNGTWGTKEVSIVNKEATNTPVVLRVSYNELWINNVDGSNVSLNNKLNRQDVVTKNWTNDFVNDFVKGDDGWYYYKKVLNAEEKVKILDSIELNEELIRNSLDYDKYKNNTYELDFNVESIQANEEAIESIWGKVVNISGNEVTW